MVSILARPEGRALPSAQDHADQAVKFQSSPAPKGGRYRCSPPITCCHRSFQSSPAPKGGRYNLERVIKGHLIMFQSSPAPKGGRYALWALACLTAVICFNPRPPRRAGATGGDYRRYAQHNVSILARPEGRALPKPLRAISTPIMFQSSPAPKGGRYE